MRFAAWRLPLLALVLAACLTVPVRAQDPAPPPPAPAFDQVAALAELKASIAGKEDLPAVEVFKNIQFYKGVSASRFLRIMEFGFTVALGVDCTHCHTPGQWDSDSKATKQIARDMSAMLAAINNEHLKKIPNLRSTNPSVNCTTCHRGNRRPALELPQALRRPGA